VADRSELAGFVPLAPPRSPLFEVVREIVARRPAVRQERLSGIHNPWGFAAGLTDPWPFLDLCESDLVRSAGRGLLGDDIILWDSELFTQACQYAAFLQQGKEGRYWPVAPLAGAIVLVRIRADETKAFAVALDEVTPRSLADFDPLEPVYVIRLMPARSRFDRDPRCPANWACMIEQVLVNYSNRPLWLISGADRAGNDLVSGFAPPVPIWVATQSTGAFEVR
jgi:hypothetical protein